MLQCSVEPSYRDQSLIASVRYDRVALKERLLVVKNTAPEYGIFNYHISQSELYSSRNKHKFINVVAYQIAEQIYKEIDNDH